MEDNHFDKTEDFSEIMDDVNETTENFDTTIDELSEKLDREMSDISREVHINDFNDDFMGLVRKRDYKGKEEDSPLPSRSSKRRKLKKWVYLVLLLAIIGIGVSVFLIIQNNKQRKLEEEKAIIDNIKSHYHEVAKVSKDTDLYEKKNDEFSKIGTIYKDTNISLVEEEITLDTKYFHIKDMDYYIPFEDVQEGIIEEQDTRYKNYLPFNLNIVTKDSFTMYQGDKKLISIDKEMEFPIIINNYENKYYVEYNGMLVNIKKDEVSKTKENKNTDKKNQAKITTLAYHRVYDTGDKCTDGYVCMKKANFDKQMKYLSDNKYFSLNMDEMYMYMKGNLQIEKGVVITLDDGLLFKAADEVLDKYGLNATMFIATAAYTNYAQFDGLKRIENQSHTHNLHRNYVCAGGNQGGAILCMSKANIVADLKKSIEILKTEPKAMAFPFYDFNDNAIAAVKEAGFKMAFIGRAGVYGKATPKVTNMYKIPRMTVWEENLMSFNEWKSYL